MIQNIKKIIVSILLFYPLISTANDVKYWKVNNSDNIIISSKVNDFYNQPIKISIDPIEASEEDEYKLLSRYYDLLKKQKTDDIYDLFYEQDKSKERLKTFIEKGNLKLDKYKELSEVSVLDSVRWGNQIFFTLRLEKIHGRSMDWSETVICNPKCYLKFDLDTYGQNKDKHFLHSVKSSFWDALAQGHFLSGTRDISKSMILSFFPAGSDSGDQIKVYLGLTKKKHKILNGQDCSSYKDRYIQSFCEQFLFIKSLDVFNKEQIDSYVQDRSILRSESMLFSLKLNQQHLVKSYSNKAFIQSVNSWKSVDVIGVVQTSDVVYVLYQPVDESGEKRPLQMVTYDRLSKKTSFGYNDAFYRLFYQHVFVKALNNVVNKWQE